MDYINLLCKMPRSYKTYFKENSESLALGYLAAYLRKHEHKVMVFDASLESLSVNGAKNKLLKIIFENKPILIGFTIADMTYIESTIEIIKFLRRNAIKSHITMGGHTPTFNYAEIFSLCPELDSIVMYEGEEAILKLANSLKEGKNWKILPNITYKDNAKIVLNSPFPRRSRINYLPFPARDYLPYVLSNLKDIGVVPIAASRGCYMNCRFCSIRKFYSTSVGKLWRGRSISNIIQEIKVLIRNYPDIKEIVLVDDVFTGPPKVKMDRMRKFRDELKNNNIQFIFSISDRADIIDEELTKIWFEIGVRQILLGLESSSQADLDKFNKKFNIEDQIEALKILEKYDIDTAISYINFTPWSTLEQIGENVKYFLSLKINLIQGMLNRYQIYDGTALAVMLEKKGQIYGEFPNKSYKTPDERVDQFYAVVNKNFNPYLFIAYRLKIIERKLRIARFDAGKKGDNNLISIINKYKITYKKMMHKIMEEAVSQFLETLEIVKNGANINKNISKEIKQNVLKKSNEWLKIIEIFMRLSILNDLDKWGKMEETSKQNGAFEYIYPILAEENERERFFACPEHILSERGINIDNDKLRIINMIGNLSIESDRGEFNEKLVLCSSSGY